MSRAIKLTLTDQQLKVLGRFIDDMATRWIGSQTNVDDMHAMAAVADKVTRLNKE